jgi:hypothetical protein
MHIHQSLQSGVEDLEQLRLLYLEERRFGFLPSCLRLRFLQSRLGDSRLCQLARSPYIRLAEVCGRALRNQRQYINSTRAVKSIYMG